MPTEGVCRVISLDGSTSNTGVWITDVNIVKPEPFKLVYANTIYGDKVNYDIPVQFDDTASTGLMARCYGVTRSLGILLDIYDVDTGISEDNFLGMSALTFKQLVQLNCLFRDLFFQRKVHLSYVLPNLAKAIVGVTGRGKTKDDVADGVKAYPWIDPGEFDLEAMDEHSIDAGAVGLYRCESIALNYGVFPDERRKAQ